MSSPSLSTSESSIAWICLDEASSSPLNPLSQKVRSFILNKLQAAIENPSIRSIVIYGKQNFSAGADLTEFGQLLQSGSIETSGSGPSLLDVVAALDACPKPTVAAIRGACLGGGLEVALACHYRVAYNKSQLGLPEVHVGVIPGAGGTQRLPRCIGLAQALTLILTGKAVDATKAKDLGLVDDVVEETHKITKGQDRKSSEVLMEKAQRWALWAQVMPVEDRRLSRQSAYAKLSSPAEGHVMLHAASLQFPTHQGANGVRAALEAIRACCLNDQDFEQGMQREGELFMQVLLSMEGQAQRHAFFAIRKCQKPLYPRISVSSHPLLQAQPSTVQVAVIGAGTMGGGIAMVLLQTGFTVWLVDVSKPALERGVQGLHKLVESYVKRRRLTQSAGRDLLVRLKPTQSMDNLSQCQLVVEAVVEKMSVKQQIFRKLADVTPSSAILLSNTSTLDIDKIATGAFGSNHGRLQQFAGWHFFSPAHVMKLVEIVVGSRTSQYTVALLQVLTKRIRKIGVVVGNCDGFCGNRLLKPYQSETVALLTEGCSIEKIDKAFLDFGMALGPFQLGDLAGNDVGYNIRKERGWVRTNKSDPTPPSRPHRYTELADDMVTILGRNGQKVMKGWYDYDSAIGKGRQGLPSDEMSSFLQSYVTNQSSANISAQEIVERVLFPLVNEGFKCLEENIAHRPSDIDVVYLYGYGFPHWRGGPMWWADNDIGLPVLLEKLRSFSRKFPGTEHYVPSKLLEECVKLQMTAEEYYQRGPHIKGRTRSRL